MKFLIAFASVLFATTAMACPEGTIALHEGDPVAVYCYETGGTLYWANVTKACLTQEDALLAYEAATDGTTRVVGMCNATFEFRY